MYLKAILTNEDAQEREEDGGKGEGIRESRASGGIDFPSSFILVVLCHSC